MIDLEFVNILLDWEHSFFFCSFFILLLIVSCVLFIFLFFESLFIWYNFIFSVISLLHNEFMLEMSLLFNIKISTGTIFILETQASLQKTRCVEFQIPVLQPVVPWYIWLSVKWKKSGQTVNSKGFSRKTRSFSSKTTRSSSDVGKTCKSMEYKRYLLLDRQQDWCMLASELWQKEKNCPILC